MIRSPHAFLVSLLLHGLVFGMAMYTFVPKPISASSSEAVYCSVKLAHVVPSLSKPVQVPESKPPQPPKKREQPKPVKTVKAPAPVPPPKRVIERVMDVPKPEPLPVAPEVSETVPDADDVQQEHMDAPAIASAGLQPMQTAVPAAQSREDYLDEHLARIAALLQKHLYYPRMARKRHIEGEVLASFTLEKDGSVSNLRLKKCARPILDKAALTTVESLSGKLPHPKNALTLEIPIRFVLQ